MKVVVAGAAGKLGSQVCAHLLAHGYDFVATDRWHRHGLPMPLELADLCDDIAVYELLKGCDADLRSRLGTYITHLAESSPIERRLGPINLRKNMPFVAPINVTGRSGAI